MLSLALKIRLFGAILVAFFALCSAGVAQENIDLEFVSQSPCSSGAARNSFFNRRWQISAPGPLLTFI
jgi:hypothetical protein